MSSSGARTLIYIVLTFFFNVILVTLNHGGIVSGQQSPSALTMRRANYGEFCNKTTRCNSSAFLSCQQEQCDCVKIDSMVFDTGEGKCLVLANEKCHVTISQDVDQNRNWLDELPCVQNAECTSSPDSGGGADGKLCICNSERSFEGSDGTCQLKGGFDDLCENDSQCDESRFLKCTGGGRCQCDPKNSFRIKNSDAHVHDLERSDQFICVGMAGESCLKGHCTSNAHCYGYYDYDYRFGSRSGTCTCNGDTEPFHGFCGLNHGDRCLVKTDKCANNLVCVDGVCSCEFPLHQVHDPITKAFKECKSLVRGPCGVLANQNYSISCVPNAHCVNQTSAVDWNYCECNSGFTENAAGGCDLAHGQPCEQLVTYSKCDQSVPLVCREGICTCPDKLQTFDSKLHKCVAKLNSFCKEAQDCADNSFCKRTVRNGRGFCSSCANQDDGGGTTVNGTCSGVIQEKKKD